MPEIATDGDPPHEIDLNLQFKYSRLKFTGISWKLQILS